MTCKRCLKSGNLRELPATKDQELIELAWMHCCQHTGAPSPIGPVRQAEIEASNRAKARADQIADLASTVATLRCLTSDELRADIARAVEACEPDIAEATRPLVVEFLLAADWLAEIEACLARADGVLGSLAPSPADRAELAEAEAALPRAVAALLRSVRRKSIQPQERAA